MGRGFVGGRKEEAKGRRVAEQRDALRSWAVARPPPFSNFPRSPHGLPFRHFQQGRRGLQYSDNFKAGAANSFDEHLEFLPPEVLSNPYSFSWCENPAHPALVLSRLTSSLSVGNAYPHSIISLPRYRKSFRTRIREKTDLLRVTSSGLRTVTAA